MAVAVFDFASICKADDGRIMVAMNDELRAVAMDLSDRPNDDAKRKITLEIEVTPEASQDGVLGNASMVFKIKKSLPARRSRPLHFGVSARGGVPPQSGITRQRAAAQHR